MRRFTPLGDQAVLAYLPDEPSAVRFAAAVKAAAPAWLHDVVPAYASAGVFFDANRIDVPGVIDWLGAVGDTPTTEPTAGRLHRIPVCYEMGPDLGRVAEQKGLPAEEVIRLHAGIEYAVYAVGFVPGFAYLGYLPEPLCRVGRLASPRVRVESGSVGLTGRQTAVYPLPRPGGWHLIGRTPVVMVDPAAGYFPLRVGDRVRFERIGEAEFRARDGERSL